MPVIGGFELVGKLQDREDTKSIPIIVISGKDDMEMRNKAFESGALDFISKGVEEEFISRVRRFIS